MFCYQFGLKIYFFSTHSLFLHLQIEYFCPLVHGFCVIQLYYLLHFLTYTEKFTWDFLKHAATEELRLCSPCYSPLCCIFWSNLSCMFITYLQITDTIINPFPNKPWFLRVCSTCLLKTMREKEKLLVTSSFSFSHIVFYLFRKLSAIFLKFEIVVSKLFQFERV